MGIGISCRPLEAAPLLEVPAAMCLDPSSFHTESENARKPCYFSTPLSTCFDGKMSRESGLDTAVDVVCTFIEIHANNPGDGVCDLKIFLFLTVPIFDMLAFLAFVNHKDQI